tara:strand:+ start:1004 stop:1276 length:273 start_codon:yes stop_codon:yes gene_type:complete
MISRAGNPVANQFIIEGEECGFPTKWFQSYSSMIAKQITAMGKTITYLDETYWNYSVTTSKYRNQFLGETTDETKAKIDSGEYLLAELNR